jgi:hypothetical protein
MGVAIMCSEEHYGSMGIVVRSKVCNPRRTSHLSHDHRDRKRRTSPSQRMVKTQKECAKGLVATRIPTVDTPV